MRTIDVRRAADEAAATNPNRPATAIVHDVPDTRLVVFRLAPGQAVAPHRNASTVMLTVLAGHGLASGGDDERPVAPGDVVVYEPGELHGMRAGDEEFLLLATITPRPGTRASTAHTIERAAASIGDSGMT